MESKFRQKREEEGTGKVWNGENGEDLEMWNLGSFIPSSS
jgi:hypothetical protein